MLTPASKLDGALRWGAPDFLLDRTMLRYVGLALLVIASQRELSLGEARPDALLQALLLFAMAALLRHLASNRLGYAALMGVALGCAYLTKSFAFVVAFLCILSLAAFRWFWLKHGIKQILPAMLAAFTCFAIVAGRTLPRSPCREAALTSATPAR